MATTFTVTAQDGTDQTNEISDFAEAIGLNYAAPGRCSLLLTLGLFGGFKSGRVDPAKVLYEIRALEGVGRQSSLKAAIQNKHPPLKGLWHKHYQETGIRSMAINLRMALHKYGLPVVQGKNTESERLGEERYLTENDIKEITHDAVVGNFLRRANDKSLTGEWIIYARHEDRNYYLALATHDPKTHEDVRRMIEAICFHEFPFLAELLANA